MTTVLPPAGHCIYCGVKDVPLTREHIVPFAIGGDLILPASSCKPCAKITGVDIEQSCLRLTFGRLRIRHKLPTRRPKERPTRFAITVGEGADADTFNVDVKHLPSFAWALPMSDLPGFFLPNLTPETTPGPSLRAIVSAYDVEQMMRFGGGTKPVGQHVASINIRLFQRMLAKIAHSFAYAYLREDFEPVLPKLILEGHNHPQFWIGGEGEAEDFPRDDMMICVQLGTMQIWTGEVFLAVRMRFFGWLGTPTYVAYVGKSRRHDLKLPEDAVYAKYVKLVLPSG